MNTIKIKYTLSTIFILLSFTLFAKPPFGEHKGEPGLEIAIIRDVKLFEVPFY